MLYRHSLLLALFFFLFSQSSVFACDQYNCEEKKSDTTAYSACLSEKRVCLESKISDIQSQKATLNSTISIISSKITLQELTISQTLSEITKLENDIELLSERISTLNFSLDQLTAMLLKRVRERYKSSVTSPITLIANSQSFSELITSSRYISQASLQTAVVMRQAELQKQLFDLQKEKKETAQLLLEQKRKLLEQQKRELASQKAGQQKILQDTKNSESVYQKQLAAVSAEFQAIQAIISGNGSEAKVGDVKAGDTIAFVISGASCNSSGTHLHFTVTENDSVKNPFSYLTSIDHTNCSGSSCGSADGDAFNPSGNLNWPLSGPIRLLQGYASTWGVQHTWVSRIYTFHNGIDITGSSSTVKAVADGTLYRGSFSGSAGCALRYVKLEHANSSIVSWYLHIYY
ncbi:MAG TPA: hypothetical protein PKH60_01540 [Candidatus Woesebacteria bacterium]|nr:hypothetical protein [Candidatus Woesebacteria bacterium]